MAVLSASTSDERRTGNTVHARMRTTMSVKSIINQVISAGEGLNGVLREKWGS
jgi:hypothetical protein